MKSYQSVAALFAVAALAQNEIPEPGITPQRYWVEDPADVDPRVRPFTNEIALVNASTIALDQAIFDAQDASGVAPALAAATSLISVIQAQAQDATTHPAIDVDVNTDEGAQVIGPLLDYTFSLYYHVNHTVNDVIAKEALVIKYCQGPVVSSLINEITNQASTLVSNIIDKVPQDLKTDAPFVTGGIFSALSTAAAAYADQSTTSPGCTPVSTTGLPTSTTGASTSTTTGGTGTGTTGGVYPTTTPPVYSTTTPPVYGTTTAPTYKPSATYSTSDDCEDDTPSTYKPSTYKPSATYSTSEDCEDGTPSTYKPSTYKPTAKPSTTDDCEDDTPSTYKPSTYKPSTYQPSTVKPSTYKPSATYDDECEDDTPTPKPSTYKPSTYAPSVSAPPAKTTTGGTGGGYTTSAAVKPTPTPSIKTYAGAGVANSVCMGTVLLTALAAFLL